MRHLLAIAMALLICCMASSQALAQSTVGTWSCENECQELMDLFDELNDGDSGEIDLWGIEPNESVLSEPIMVLDGTLDDHQDNDTFQINTSAETVHNIRIESAVDPILIEVWSESGKIAELQGLEGQVALVSGEGSNIQLDVQSVSFNGSNPYQIQIHSATGDSTVNIQPDFKNASTLIASGYLHDADLSGDVAIFKVGGNAALNVSWHSFGDVNFTGHIIRTSDETMTSFELLGGTGRTSLHIPETESGLEEWEIVFGMRSTGTGWWSIGLNASSFPDQHCSHDCSSIIDASILPTDAFHLEKDGTWSTHGGLSEIDTADVYPIFIPGELWETHRLIATLATPTAQGMEIQIQSWNNSAEFLSVKEIEVGTEVVGLNMTPGYHFVIVRHGIETTGGDYYLVLNTINITDEDDEPIDPNDLQDLWEKFTVFYIIVAILLLAPFFWVLWVTRGNRIGDEVQAHERVRLRHLRERLSKLLTAERSDETAIEDALGMLAAIQWKAIESEMGDAKLTHQTDAVTIKAWHIAGTKLLIGIHIDERAWELAALRFEAIEGPEWKIVDVSPKSLFDGDEIYLDTMSEGTTTFLQLTLEGRAQGLDLHLSGLVDGKPLAAVPAKALLFSSEEE